MNTVSRFCLLMLLVPMSVFCQDQENLNPDLKVAIRDGNKEEIGRLIKEGADPNYQGGSGDHMLCYADPAVIPLLVSLGANLNLKAAGVEINKKPIGTPLLILCARRGKEELLLAMLQAGADPNVKDALGGSLFNEMCFDGHSKVVQFLIEKKVDVNAVDANGSTPLMYALLGLAGGASPVKLSRQTEVVRTLLKSGANVNAKDRSGSTALIRAAGALGDHLELVQFLVDAGADLDVKDAYGHTALSQALEMGNAKTAEFLKKKGAK